MPRPSSSARKVPPDDAAPFSRVGEPILRSGIYQVFHAGHRMAHNVVLIAGEAFPRCVRCGNDVRFRLKEATSDLKSDPDFRVRLYEIPHPAPPDDEEEGAA